MCSSDSYHSKSSSYTSSIDINNNSVSDFDNSNDTIYAFGNFQDTLDWIECESTTFPGEIYYFNLRSSCSTWIRPLPHSIKLQRFHKKSRIYDDENVTHDLDAFLMVVSEDEEELKDYECNKSEVATLKVGGKNNQIFDKDLEMPSQLCDSLKTREYSNTCDTERFGTQFCTFQADFKEHNYPKFVNSPSYDTVIYSDVAKGKLDQNRTLKKPDLNTSTNNFRLGIKNGSLADSNNFSSINETPFASSTWYKNNYDTDVSVKCYVPRLKKIEPKYLVNNVQNDEKISKQAIKKKAPNKRKLKPTKIICEMYGTKTISYDPIEPQLPPGCKVTTLSESTVTSSLRQNEKDQKSVVLSNYILNLSSTSSSCTCSSCSSTTTTSTSTTSKSM